MDRLCLAVKGNQQHGVGIAAPRGILSHQKEGIYSGTSSALGHVGQLGPVKIRGAVPWVVPVPPEGSGISGSFIHIFSPSHTPITRMDRTTSV